VDTEAIFKTGRPTPPSVLRSVREKLLPLTTVLSATVPEMKLLLDDAGIPVKYPKSIEDVVLLGKSVEALGPQHVLIKREIFDEGAKTTTLHYVLCGPGEPVIAASTVENVRGVTGLSYLIPCKQLLNGRKSARIVWTDWFLAAIAANLANGTDVSVAVSAAFKFVQDMVSSGVYFE
jgi:hydroxymethylpyrimidine/phosphomethylpyrimidine kinase